MNIIYKHVDGIIKYTQQHNGYHLDQHHYLDIRWLEAYTTCLELYI